MKELPYVEEIYDMETSQLEALKRQLDEDLINEICELPARFDNYEKYRKKLLKLQPHLELELEERGQIDNVLSFFIKSDKDDKFLNDDEFFKLPDMPNPTIEQPNSDFRKSEATTIEESKSEIGYL